MKLKRSLVWMTLVVVIVSLPVSSMASNYLNNMLSVTQLYTYLASTSLNGAMQGRGGSTYSSSDISDVYLFDSIKFSVSKEHHIALESISTEIQIDDETITDQVICLVMATQFQSVKEMISELQNQTDETMDKQKAIALASAEIATGKSVELNGISYLSNIGSGTLSILVVPSK